MKLQWWFTVKRMQPDLQPETGYCLSSETGQAQLPVKYGLGSSQLTLLSCPSDYLIFKTPDVSVLCVYAPGNGFSC